MNNLIRKTEYFTIHRSSLAKRKWLRFLGLTILELILVTILALPFLETTAAHPALPEDLKPNPKLVNPAGPGSFADTGPVNNGPEAAIPALQDTTTLSITINTSPEALIDNNNNTFSNEFPEVTVIAATVNNQSGTETAENVTVVLDYNESAPWLLVGDEVPTRSVGSLAPNETVWVYWFAQHISTTENITHSYTVTADADNAPQVSTSENNFAPGLGYTIITTKYADTANQGLEATTVGSSVGVPFTMTQVFSTSDKPDFFLLGPVGNASFDAGAYRLQSVSGRFLSGTTEIGTFSDDVYVTVPAALQNDTDAVEVSYQFVPLLPKTTTTCPYMGVLSLPSKKYDNRWCSGVQNIAIGGTLDIEMSKTVNLATVEQGQQLQYTIDYTNTGTQTVSSLWIWDDVPTDVSILTGTISTSGAGTATYSESESSETRASWNITNIAPGAGQIQFSVLVDGNGADIADGTVILNEANLAIIEPSNAADNYRVLADTATSTVQTPVLAVTKSDNTDTASPGETLTYVIEIANTGSTAATLLVTDTLPSNIVTPVSTPDPANTGGDGTTSLTWNNLTVAAGATRTVTVTVRVDPELSATGTDLINQVAVSYQNAGAHTFPTQTDSDTTKVTVPTTSLDLTKTATDLDGAPLLAGDTIRYSVQVTNTGAFTSYNVVVSDTLPNDTTCVTASATAGTGATCPTPPASLITWNVGSLGTNQSETMTIDVTINQDVAANTSIVNSASVTSTNVTTPPTPPEVCPDGSTTVPCTGGSTPEPATTLVLTKTAEVGGGNAGILEVGDTITYTVWVTNATANTAYGVVVTDTLSDYVTCQNASASTGTPACPSPIVWTVGNLAGNAGANMQIVVTINDPSGLGQNIINTATATSDNVFDPAVAEICPDNSTPTGGICSTTPTGPSTTLAMTKTAVDADGPPLAVGDTITYTIQVTNTGAFTSSSVVVTDDLPDDITCVNTIATVGSATCADPLTWLVGPLSPSGGSATLLIEATIDLSAEGKTLTNTATVTGTNITSPTPEPPDVCPDGSTPDPGPPETCPETPVLLDTTLELTKTAVADNPLAVGGNITYTVTVTNTGANTAYNVVITDTLSPYVTCVTVLGGPGACADPIVWTIPELAAGEFRSMMIFVTVNPSGAEQSITNSVVVSGVNVINPPTVPPVCPDGSTPNPDCPEETIPPSTTPVTYLPIIIKN